jgi:hypothetical protein
VVLNTPLQLAGAKSKRDRQADAACADLQAPLMDDGEAHCADYVYVYSGAGASVEVVSAQLAGAEPHPADETLYPSDHLGVAVRLRIGPAAAGTGQLT